MHIYCRHYIQERRFIYKTYHFIHAYILYICIAPELDFRVEPAMLLLIVLVYVFGRQQSL